jgi:uncharacterized protein DUF2846
MHLLRSVIIAFSCILLVSCASEGVRPVNPAAAARIESVPNSMARVVIYREDNAIGGMLSPTVTVNGHDLVNVGNGTVFVGAFRPGHYVFESNDKNSGTELDLKAGSSVFIKMEIVPGIWRGNGKLQQVAVEQGTFEAKRLKPVKLDDIEDPAYRWQQA